MIQSRDVLCQLITVEKAKLHEKFINIPLMAASMVERALQIIKETTAEFITKESIPLEKQTVVHIDFKDLQPQIEAYLNSQFFAVVHAFFNYWIYPRLSDEELLVVSTFPTATPKSPAYSNAHRYFDELVENHVYGYLSSILSAPLILEKNGNSYLARLAIETLETQSKEQGIRFAKS